ncbi:3-dehydroquinate synthase [Salisediminibacterium beveridgei]|uniref:3-dehydroquinate synthase n=1 Tax=Salisediminibacterium beveridgei TaxID=632773 RepID=A0A1D7QV21_9BACI|nr:3-dehydroquinate synthase [Salisediminibacterium beveridgei]AOM82808.1 3-dehydroquinate synthase [Salisediminibacterium beveridgei]
MIDPAMTIQASTHAYPVWIGQGILSSIGEAVQMTNPDCSRIMIITDQHVEKLYGNKIKQYLSEYNHVHLLAVPSGEESKSFDTYYEVMTAMLEAELDRKSLILAIGGGVVGDLAGFAAATYMRGIDFIQVPTTLLAHDSSVGGKTGINHPLGKNLIGSFHAPQAVIYDVDVFSTLSDREWRSGFAEVIKHGFIQDGDFLDWLVNEFPPRDQLTPEVIRDMLSKSIAIKANIVQKDEREKGVRAFLNFGHTLGHAIENDLGYGEITHGEAVMIGIHFALQLGDNIGMLKMSEVNHVLRFIEEQGFELKIPEACSTKRLIERMKRDKKSNSGNIHFVLLRTIGTPDLIEVHDDHIYNTLEMEGIKR